MGTSMNCILVLCSTALYCTVTLRGCAMERAVDGACKPARLTSPFKTNCSARVPSPLGTCTTTASSLGNQWSHQSQEHQLSGSAEPGLVTAQSKNHSVTSMRCSTSKLVSSFGTCTAICFELGQTSGIMNLRGSSRQQGLPLRALLPHPPPIVAWNAGIEATQLCHSDAKISAQ